MMEVENDFLFHSAKEIILKSRERVFRMANSALLISYWEIGRLIVEDEQQGKQRAEYGKGVLRNLSERLTFEFGKGFDITNLRNMRMFYLAFPIRETMSLELSWSHYRLISAQTDSSKRQYYLSESIQNNWNVRDLRRQINSFAYERVLKHKTEEKENITSILKDPYIFESNLSTIIYQL